MSNLQKPIEPQIRELPGSPDWYSYMIVIIFGLAISTSVGFLLYVLFHLLFMQ